MRRFSQKNALVTLSDINVTPLLDLAFVLLIIFVITTPLLEQGMSLELPRGGRPDDPQLEQSDLRTVEVTPQGTYLLDGEPQSLDALELRLVDEAGRNPRLVVVVRGDRRTSWESVANVVDRCQRRGITRIHFRTVPE
ncbi:MAG: biopolymer transporter ExbD [Verrucomicrobiae bacterium]|nr:biopolymer transporter ExbD [Verrucomicrobiae bacterium]